MENKKLLSLISSKSAQIEIKRKEQVNIQSSIDISLERIHNKEFSILDITQRCQELANRYKEYLALYEILKNDRNKTINLIHSHEQTLTEITEKLFIMNEEVCTCSIL